MPSTLGVFTDFILDCIDKDSNFVDAVKDSSPMSILASTNEPLDFLARKPDPRDIPAFDELEDVSPRSGRSVHIR